MTKTKAKRNTAAKNGLANKSAEKKDEPEEKKIDLEEMRKDILAIVNEGYKQIAIAVVNLAKNGQLSHAKYVFEMIGVYPQPSGDSEVKMEDDSLAKILLERMNIPFGTVPRREDENGVVRTASTMVEAEKGIGENPVQGEIGGQG